MWKLVAHALTATIAASAALGLDQAKPSPAKQPTLVPGGSPTEHAHWAAVASNTDAGSETPYRAVWTYLLTKDL